MTTVRQALSMYWAASCGGCEIAVLNIGDAILELETRWHLVFCPCLMDTKRRDVEAMADGDIAVTLFNGAIRTEENREMAELLRRKSRVLVAFGSCAAEGCVPGLSNLSSARQHFQTIYGSGPTIDNPAGVTPRTSTLVREGELTLPAFFDRVRTLADVVEVDYTVPGCPPEPGRIREVLTILAGDGDLPPRGSVLGAGVSTVCAECTRDRRDKAITALHRPHEIVPDDTCLLDQGMLCMGIATRDGCGALCPQVAMPCTGCYGPPEGVADQGAAVVAAIGSALELGGHGTLDASEIAQRSDEILDGIPDLSGSLYRYSLAASILGGKLK